MTNNNCVIIIGYRGHRQIAVHLNHPWYQWTHRSNRVSQNSVCSSRGTLGQVSLMKSMDSRAKSPSRPLVVSSSLEDQWFCSDFARWTRWCDLPGATEATNRSHYWVQTILVIRKVSKPAKTSVLKVADGDIRPGYGMKEKRPRAEGHEMSFLVKESVQETLLFRVDTRSWNLTQRNIYLRALHLGLCFESRSSVYGPTMGESISNRWTAPKVHFNSTTTYHSFSPCDGNTSVVAPCCTSKQSQPY